MEKEHKDYSKSYLIIGASSDVAVEYIRSLAKHTRNNAKNPILICAHYYRNKDKLEEIAREYSGIELKLLQADLTEEEQALKLVNQVMQYVKYPNYILHFPAMTFDYMRYREMDTDYLRQEMNVQLYSFLIITREFLPLMHKEYGNRVLVMLTSYLAEELPPKFMADYVVAKYALLGAMKAAAAEYGGKNLKINGISPIMMDTKFLSKIDSKIKELTAMKSSINRVPKPEELIPYIDELLDSGCTKNGYNLVIDESYFEAKEPEE